MIFNLLFPALCKTGFSKTGFTAKALSGIARPVNSVDKITKTIRHTYWCRAAALLLIACCAPAWSHQHASAQVDSVSCTKKQVISVHCGQVPTAAVVDNQLWVVFVQGQHVWLVQSNDWGKTYSQPVKVNADPQRIYANGENRPKIAISGAQVYVSWTEQTEGKYTGNIRFARSLDAGKTFAPNLKVNDDGLLTSHRFDALYLANSGRIYLTWLDKRDKVAAQKSGKEYAGSGLYYAVSDNGGASFGSNRKLADNSCECCRIAVDQAAVFEPKDAELAVFWRHIFNGERDHGLLKLGAAGLVGEVQRATVDRWQIDACPHHGPALATAKTPDRAGYHLAWFSEGTEHQGLYYGFADAAGNVSAQIMDAAAGAAHPQVYADGKNVYYVWKLFDGNATQLMLQTSADGGRSWQASRAVAHTEGGSDHPLLSASPTDVVLSWQSEKEGLRFFRINRI